MPDLPPLARISAAIEKLERLKADADSGPWWVEFQGTIVGPHDIVADLMQEPTADLIVTLHRTIPTLLTILKHAEWLGESGEYHGPILDLANAINGDAILGGES